MLKIKVLAHTVTEIVTGPLRLKPARMLFRLWATNMVFGLVVLMIGVIASGWLTITVGVVNLAVNAVMVKLAARRYADAKRREERAEWERAMFVEWAR